MQDKPIPWKKLGQRTAYRDRVHIMRHEVELPNGEQMFYDVEHSDGFAMATLMKTEDNMIVLSHQYRFPLDRWIYDLPGGGAPAGEDLEAAAIRECREEVGLAPKNMTKLVTFFTAPGRSNWPVHLYYSEDFESSKIDLNDPAEHVEKILMPAAELKKLINTQEIVDSSLLIAWHTACSRGLIKV
jgi:ADP-ribose pyrophosphatase